MLRLMRNLWVCFGLCVVSALAWGDEAAVLPVDLSVLSESDWSGELVYLDYGSGKDDRIPVSLHFEQASSKKIVYRIRFPRESQYNEKSKLKISAKGKKLNGERVVSRMVDIDGKTTIVTQSRGKDDGRPADIRTTYALSADRLVITKEVRFESEDYFRRNAYELTRQ
ncbi:MAG: hypothetical protein AB8F65_06165 [Woeseiaceae bacterium]